MTDPQTYEEMRETVVRAVKWLRTSRAKAAPDALTALAYLAAREHLLEQKVYEIDRLIHGMETDDPTGPTRDPRRGAEVGETQRESAD